MSEQPAVYILTKTRNMEFVIIREKRIKNWRRDRKLELTESESPDWLDLYDPIV